MVAYPGKQGRPAASLSATSFTGGDSGDSRHPLGTAKSRLAYGVATIRKFVAKEKLKFPVVMSTPKLLSTYGIEGIPTNYLLDSSGKIVFHSVGYDEAGLMKALAKLGLK